MNDLANLEPGAAHAPHVLPPRVLLATAGALVALTVATVVTSRIDLGALNVVLALAIAAGKAAVVALFFMHLRYEHGGLEELAALLVLQRAELIDGDRHRRAQPVRALRCERRGLHGAEAAVGLRRVAELERRLPRQRLHDDLVARHTDRLLTGQRAAFDRDRRVAVGGVRDRDREVERGAGRVAGDGRVVVAADVARAEALRRTLPDAAACGVRIARQPLHRIAVDVDKSGAALVAHGRRVAVARRGADLAQRATDTDRACLRTGLRVDELAADAGLEHESIARGLAGVAVSVLALSRPAPGQNDRKNR